jgi:hypothetical protein
MVSRAFSSKSSGRVPWWTAIIFAIFTALLFESLTVLVFYSYLEKENRVLGEQRAALSVSERRNAQLISELSELNSSVQIFMSGLGSVNQAIDNAHHHLGKYDAISGSHGTDFFRMKAELAKLRNENSLLRSEPRAKPHSDIKDDSVKDSKRWLTIGIPTVPRKGNPDYLSQTVDAIIKQLPLHADDPLYAKVMVVVLNNKPGQHTLFDQVRRDIENGPYRFYFRFEESAVQDIDHVHNPEGNANVPGSKVNYHLHFPHIFNKGNQVASPVYRCDGKREPWYL